MAVPNLNNEQGIFFETIEGISDFEERYPSYYERAIPYFGYLSKIENNTIIDCCNMVYMPVRITNSWVKPYGNQSFNSSFPYTEDNYKGGIHLRFTKYSNSNKTSVVYDIPICLARKGNRVKTENYYSGWIFDNGGAPASRIFDFFYNKKLTYYGTSSKAIYITQDRCYFSGGSSYPYSSKRNWIGIALQAGGQNGDHGHWGHDGDGGSGGAFWLGIVNIRGRSARIEVDSYSWENHAGGQSVRLYVDNVEVLRVNGGGKGGNAVQHFNDSYLVTYKEASGGYGPSSGDGGTTSITPYEAPLKDVESIDFVRFRGGYHSNDTGGGGASVMSFGGSGAGYNGSGQDMNTDHNFGAGTGGGGWGGWDPSGYRGGYGGYAYITVGY